MNFLSPDKISPHLFSLLETHGKKVKSALWDPQSQLSWPFASPSWTLSLPDPLDKPDPGKSPHWQPLRNPPACRPEERAPRVENLTAGCTVVREPACNLHAQTSGFQGESQEGNWTVVVPESQVWGDAAFLRTRDDRERHGLKQWTHCEQMTNCSQKHLS